MSNMDIGPDLARLVKKMFAGIFKLLFRGFKTYRAKKKEQQQQVQNTGDQN